MSHLVFSTVKSIVVSFSSCVQLLQQTMMSHYIMYTSSSKSQVNVIGAQSSPTLTHVNNKPGFVRFECSHGFHLHLPFVFIYKTVRCYVPLASEASINTLVPSCCHWSELMKGKSLEMYSDCSKAGVGYPQTVGPNWSCQSSQFDLQCPPNSVKKVFCFQRGIWTPHKQNRKADVIVTLGVWQKCSSVYMSNMIPTFSLARWAKTFPTPGLKGLALSIHLHSLCRCTSIGYNWSR